MFEPMQTAVGLMAKAFGIPNGRLLMYNVELNREMEAYTEGQHPIMTSKAIGSSSQYLPQSKPPGIKRDAQAKITLQALSPFMTE